MHSKLYLQLTNNSTNHVTQWSTENVAVYF